jgi:hypothetical protein
MIDVFAPLFVASLMIGLFAAAVGVFAGVAWWIGS